ncbi:MAG TPA: hypothetical protein VIR76_11375, partial [Pusillimonas sp.]
MLSGGKKTVMSMLIFQQYATIFDCRFGAALSVALLITTLGLITLYLLVGKPRGRKTVREAAT